LTLEGLHGRYRDARLWAVFEPRTNTTRRRVFQDDYAGSFDAADRIVVAAVHEPHRAPARDRFSPDRLVRDLKKRGRAARFLPTVDEILAHLVRECGAGDVVVFLSNGAFGGIHRRFLDALS
jgi:UDP-N-acetylmuramate: L-alanyl-gamma-D-glutamyl-meso-diaminopimelate ligase